MQIADFLETISIDWNTSPAIVLSYMEGCPGESIIAIKLIYLDRMNDNILNF